MSPGSAPAATGGVLILLEVGEGTSAYFCIVFFHQGPPKVTTCDASAEYNGPRKLDTKRDGFKLHLSHGADKETVLTSI